MDLKVIAFLFIVLLPVEYLLHEMILKPLNIIKKPEIAKKQGSVYLASLKEYLKSEIDEDNQKEKSFIGDFMSTFNPKVQDKKDLPLSTLVYKVVEIKVEKFYSSTNDNDLSLIGAVFGLIVYFVVSKLLEYVIIHTKNCLIKFSNKILSLIKFSAEFKKLASILMILTHLGLLFLFTFFSALIGEIFTLMSTAFTNYHINLKDKKAASNQDSLTDSETKSSYSSLPTKKSKRSKIPKVDGRKIDRKAALFYRFVYEYAVSHGSKIPRINALIEKLN